MSKEELERLRVENAQLKAENKKLRSWVSELEAKLPKFEANPFKKKIEMLSRLLMDCVRYIVFALLAFISITVGLQGLYICSLAFALLAVFCFPLTARFLEKEKKLIEQERGSLTKEKTFSPQYTIGARDDLSMRGVKRKELKIKLAEGLDKQAIRKNIKHAVDSLLKKERGICAVVVFAYRENDNVHMGSPVAKGTFAPQGDWSKANQFKSYKDNQLKVRFFEHTYFKKENKDPLQSLKKGEKILLKSGVKVSSSPTQWNPDDIILTLGQKEDATVVRKKTYPMGSYDIIRYRVKVKGISGWIHSHDIETKALKGDEKVTGN